MSFHSVEDAGFSSTPCNNRFNVLQLFYLPTGPEVSTCQVQSRSVVFHKNLSRCNVSHKWQAPLQIDMGTLRSQASVPHEERTHGRLSAARVVSDSGKSVLMKTCWWEFSLVTTFRLAGSGAHPDCLPVASGGSFLEIKLSKYESDYSSPSSSGMCGALPTLSRIRLHVVVLW